MLHEYGLLAYLLPEAERALAEGRQERAARQPVAARRVPPRGARDGRAAHEPAADGLAAGAARASRCAAAAVPRAPTRDEGAERRRRGRAEATPRDDVEAEIEAPAWPRHDDEDGEEAASLPLALPFAPPRPRTAAAGAAGPAPAARAARAGLGAPCARRAQLLRRGACAGSRSTAVPRAASWRPQLARASVPGTRRSTPSRRARRRPPAVEARRRRQAAPPPPPSPSPPPGADAAGLSARCRLPTEVAHDPSR